MSRTYVQNFNWVEVVASFYADVINLTLNVEALIRVVLYDDKDRVIKTVFVELTGEDYKKWATDDSFIISYICTKYGFKLLNHEESKNEKSLTIENDSSVNNIQTNVETNAETIVETNAEVNNDSFVENQQENI
jgi:hypothetical protein